LDMAHHGRHRRRVEPRHRTEKLSLLQFAMQLDRQRHDLSFTEFQRTLLKVVAGHLGMPMELVKTSWGFIDPLKEAESARVAFLSRD